MLSRNIEKDLDAIGYTVTNPNTDRETNNHDNTKNQMFLKVIIENVTSIETKIKTVQQEIKSIKEKSVLDNQAINELNKKIQELKKETQISRKQ